MYIGTTKTFTVTQTGTNHKVSFDITIPTTLGTSVLCKMNGTTVATISTTGSSFQNITLPSALATGSHTIEFVTSGQVSGSGKNFTIDNVKVFYDVTSVQTNCTQLLSIGDYKYGFNGQERDNEVSGKGNSYTAEFWQYDPRLGRRWNLDPKPNLSISSYATFANNPQLFIDILGDTIYVFNSLGLFVGIVDDGKKDVIGHFWKNSKELVTFSFNDLKNDRELLTSGGMIVQLRTDDEIKNLIYKSGVYTEKAQKNPLSYAWDEGKNKGELDFSEGTNSPDRPSRFILNIVKSKNGAKGYNRYDFGNFLTGKALKELGISEFTAKIGAHVNSIRSGFGFDTK